MFKTKLSILTQLALLGSSAFAMDSGGCPFTKEDVLRGFYGDNLEQTYFDSVLSNKKVEIGGSSYAISVKKSPQYPYPTLANLRSTTLSDIVFGKVIKDGWSQDSLNFFTIKCSGTGASRTLTFTLNEYYRVKGGKDKFQRLLAKSGIDTALHIGWPELNFEFTLTGTWPGSTSSSSSGSSGYGYGGYGSGSSSSSSSYQQQEEAARKAKEEAARKAQEEAFRRAQEEAARRQWEEQQERVRKEREAREEKARQEESQRKWREQQEQTRKAQEEAFRRAQEEQARKASSSSSSGTYGAGYGTGAYGSSSSKPGPDYGTGTYGSSSSSSSYYSQQEQASRAHEEAAHNAQQEPAPKTGDTRINNGKRERWNGSRWARI